MSNEPQDEDDDSIKPSDSVSEVMTRRDRRKSGSVTSSVSSVAYARIKAEAKHAALLARASALRTKQELEAEELRLKAKKEQLELDTEISASNAVLKVLKEYEKSQDGMNYYYRSQTPSGDSFKGRKQRQVQPVSNLCRKSEPMSSTQDQSSIQRLSQLTTDHGNTQQSIDDSRYLFNVMHRQNEITELLVKQQSLSQLPQRDVPIFSGDPLVYISFIRAFEHSIENKTNTLLLFC